MATFLKRMSRAARLDPQLYEEVEADKGATAQAMVIVVLASVGAGIGYANPWGLWNGLGNGRVHPYALIFLGLAVLASIAGWFVWALLTYWFGARLFPEEQTRSDIGELLRTIGFSSAPGLFRVFGLLDPIRNVVFVVVQIWMLVAMVIAVRQALDYRSTWRAIGVCAWGWFVQIMLLLPFWMGMFGGSAADS